MTKREAMAVAEKIRKYWAERGHKVKTEITLTQNGLNYEYGVKSDLRNGLPRKAAA